MRAPVRGYELSIYAATPLAFWGGIAVAVLLAIGVVFTTSTSRWVHRSGLLLAGSSMWTVIALPLVRGYHFFGAGDGLTHLGFARSIASGGMSPIDLFHPGVHLLSIAISTGSGIRLTRSMMLAVSLFFLVFFVFVPLAVKRITRSSLALPIGLFSALLVLPINNVSTHTAVHPSSQMALFLPFVLYLLVLYLVQEPSSSRRVSPIGLLLGFLAFALTLYHPQETLNIILIFGSVAVVQVLYRRVWPSRPISQHRLLSFQTGWLLLVFLLWTPRRSRFQSRLDLISRTLLNSPEPAGSTVGTYSNSVGSVGGSLEELFVKIFLVSFVFSAIAGVTILGAVIGRFEDSFPECNAIVRYFGVALFNITVLMGLVYLANFGDHYFRYVGFMMGIVTIVAAAALATAVTLARERIDRSSIRVALTLVVVVLFVVALPVSAMSIYSSPWIYQANNHVPEARMNGYQTAFDHMDHDVGFANIRGGPRRQADAVLGPQSPTAGHVAHNSTTIPGRVFGTNLTSYYNDSRYVPVTVTDVQREVQLYHGFRYGQTGFQKLDITPGINRIQANDDIRFYYIRNDSR